MSPEEKQAIRAELDAEAWAATEAARAVRKAASDAIAAGAAPCSCGERPHGIAHQATLGKRVITDYEIGCFALHYAEDGSKQRAPFVRSPDRSAAVAEWNALIAGATEAAAAEG